MKQPFLPEGRLRFTPENQALCATREGLRRAREEHTILEGVALRCDARHDLTVRVGTMLGRIPREETALGIAEGTTKEVAILSRVGRSICFTVTDAEGEVLLLSRCEAQKRAQEHILTHWQSGQLVSTTVTRLESFGLFVDLACGLPSMLPLEQLSVSRIPHPRVRFRIGDTLSAVVTGVDTETGRVSLSHKALLGTWAENAALFSTGETVTGVVRSIKGYGVFVELTPNLSGLAEPCSGLAEGDRVSVYLKAIQPERYKIKLVILDKLPPDAELLPSHCFVQGERLDSWRYRPEDDPLW